MVSEKTPVLLKENEYESQKDKLCPKSTISWIIGTLLLVLFVLVSIEFLYPVVQRKLMQNVDPIRIYEEESIQAKEKPQVMTDYISEEVHKGTKKQPWDFEFLIDPSHLCDTRTPPNSEQYQRDPEIKLLMMVQSSTGHFQHRSAIRKTWGSVAENPLGPMRLGFVLGTTRNETEANLIIEESLRYKDIVQVDFEDAYNNLTTKSVLMLKWIARRCPHAQFFLKADDDTFVNVGILTSILGNEPFLTEDKFIGGNVHVGAIPSRITEETYYVAESDYPDNYPSYASGSAYVMTGPTAVQLFEASKEVQPFLPLEDVFITGLCGKYIDATLIHDPRFRGDDPPSPPSWPAFSTLATAHSVAPDILELIWDDMTRSTSDHQQSTVDASVILRSIIPDK